MQSKNYKLWLFLLLAHFMTSCGANNMDTYQQNQIDGLSVRKSTDGSLVMTVTPMLETLYAFSGAVVKEKSDAVLIELVRCRINTKCPVDVDATPDPANPGSYNMVLPKSDKPIKIDYRSGVVQVWP